MLTKVSAGPYTVRGVSIGGVYTSLEVPELGALFDCGIATRSLVSSRNIFLSHGHADHVGALPALLGIRGLMGQPKPTIFAPEPVVQALSVALANISTMVRHPLEANWVSAKPGDEHRLRADLGVRVFRTHHTIASVGYQFYRPVEKLKQEFLSLPGEEIGRRRRAGEDLFDQSEHLELAYATDTLLRVIDTTPSLLKTRVLVMECSFVNDKKSLADSRSGCHVHLDELLERADEFENEALVLMHFSQLASPSEVRRELARRCPAKLKERLVIFAPERGPWPG